MKYYVIAGEASGDLHASKLIAAIKRKDPEASFGFIGGDLMEKAASSDPDFHFREMNFMGFLAVIRHLGTLRSILKKTKANILKANPDAVILVDYAGFNLRIAKFASRQHLRVFYYISPKVWAWRSSRIKKLKKFVNKLFVIFPFEVEYFRNNNMEVEYHGNPLMDGIDHFMKNEMNREAFRQKHHLGDQLVLALLAGSRRQEIQYCLPEMIKSSTHFKDHVVVVAGAPSVDEDLYTKMLDGTDVRIVYNETYHLLSIADLAIVTSGTATLETCLFNVPQVVVYKTGGLTYRLGRLLVKFRFFSLVNLMLDKEIVKEILQFELAEKIKFELEDILNKPKHRSGIIEGYELIKQLIGEPGVSDRVADKMLELMQ